MLPSLNNSSSIKNKVSHTLCIANLFINCYYDLLLKVSIHNNSFFVNVFRKIFGVKGRKSSLSTFSIFIYAPENILRSFCTSVIPAMLNFSTRTFITLGDKNAGKVGPK